MKISHRTVAACTSAIIGFGLLASLARAQPNDLEVGVRSYVPDTTYLWAKDQNKIPGDGGHSRIYGILKVDEIKAVDRLVKKVDEKALLSLLLHQLDVNGFHEFVPPQKPEILLTVSYGRGELMNPYIGDTGEVGGAPGGATPSPQSQVADGSHGGQPQLIGAPSLESAPLSQTITGAMANQLFDDKGNGHEAKLQKATFEKIYIRITAWQYPVGQAKPKMLWKTVMVVDDPDHRDLNDVAAAMLEAGAPYFDKLIKEPEAEVHKPLPNGQVKVGRPVVGDPFDSKKK